MRDYKIGFAIKENSVRNKSPVFETGFTSVEEAVAAANHIIVDKFGSKEQLELTRIHSNRSRH
jgi:hypothetical protein